MFALLALGANSLNQLIFGATLGLTLAFIMHYWIKPYFIDLQSRFTKKQSSETSLGDKVYEDRYMLNYRHLAVLAIVTLVLPLAMAYLLLMC